MKISYVSSVRNMRNIKNIYSFVRKGPSARDIGCYCAARVPLDWKYIIIIIITRVCNAVNCSRTSPARPVS